MQPSKSELMLIIASEGRHWGLAPMVSQFGDVLVAELLPTVLPLTKEMSIVEDVKRDITSISDSYRWSSLLRNRYTAKNRSAALAREIRDEVARKEQEAKDRDLKYAINSDLRDIRRGKQVFGGYSDSNTRASKRRR